MVEQRILALENVINGLTDQLNGFGSEVARIVTVIDTNDTNTKSAIQTDRDRTELRMNTVERSIVQSDQRMSAVEQEQIDITTQDYTAGNRSDQSKHRASRNTNTSESEGE